MHFWIYCLDFWSSEKEKKKKSITAKYWTLKLAIKRRIKTSFMVDVLQKTDTCEFVIGTCFCLVRLKQIKHVGSFLFIFPSRWSSLLKKSHPILYIPSKVSIVTMLFQVVGVVKSLQSSFNSIRKGAGRHFSSQPGTKEELVEILLK